MCANMSKVESKLRETCLSDPNQTQSIVITVKDRLRQDVAERLGLTEVQGLNIYCGSLDGQTILSLEEDKDILSVEKDSEASIL